MKNFHIKILLFVCFILRGSLSFAQAPANNECEGAITINNVSNGINCSANGAFTNVRATPSTVTSVSCLSANGADVWFKFTALKTDVRITVIGATSTDPGGTLRRPEVALYYGTTCDDKTEVRCDRDLTGDNTVELYFAGLFPGSTYYVRVQGASSGTGTFRLCINNYNPPANISSDCPTSAMLCDKSPFAVQSVTGAGSNPREMDGASCFSNGIPQSNVESNSTWFKWTCQQSGTLTFTITPTRLDDDIDFIVYEMYNGIQDCNSRTIVRCMATGETPGGCKVHGPTGLRDGETDISEPSGCAPGQNGFVRPLDMVAGRSYALVINNFSSTGNGFNISFGGTGTFLGPEAKINFSKSSKTLCLGEDITYTDASTFAAGQISKRQWRFGKDASVDTASGAGPFKVFYKSPGWKAVVLTVTTDRGCQVTTILDSVFVEGFKYDSLVRQPTCDLGNNGMIRLRVTNCGRAPILYNWENTGFTTRDSLSNLQKGIYRVAITDSSRVYIDTFIFRVSPLEITLDTALPAVKNPSCFGFQNGEITLKPATGRSPYEYSWNGRPWTLDNKLSALGAGQVTVNVRDANDCKGSFTFDVVAPPKLEVSVDTINISCYGLTDGKAIAKPAGGVGGYRVNWSNGALGDTAVNLRKGNYNVTIFDANNCITTSSVLIKEPNQILLNATRIKPAKCYGDSTGELVVLGAGGTPPYRYSIDGVRFQNDTAFLKIPAKKYNVVVRDSTGCKTTYEVTVPQPPQLQVNAGVDLEIDLGLSATLRAVVVPTSKSVSYIWTPQDTTLSCKVCAIVTVTPLVTTTYRVSVKDSTNCTASDEVIVRVIKRRPIYIPNTFSPNGDGVNDYFTAYGNVAALRIKEMKIFDRWGGLVYIGTNLPLGGDRLGWDGTLKDKDMTPGVYVYAFTIEFIDGEEVLYKGDVTLMR
ncbi:MAG: gliding motility-associated C-terminal domain-containing protein [Saprospiraceae bacterium]|nr:gliding motility-associated C-terminal domain-containing protein [Saprospiraceae bacterium]